MCAFLVSGFLYSLAVYLVLGSSFPVLVIYSFLLRGTAVASGSCLLLLWGASSYSLSRVVSCFCFLGRLFRLFSWFQGFLSYFSDLVFCSSQSCLGLQWFLVLSIPLLGFSVTSSHCGVSHLLTWSLFLSAPGFCT